MLYEDFCRNFEKAWKDRDLGSMEDLHGPFLVNVPSEFTEARDRILYVGQETFEWSTVADFLDRGRDEKLRCYCKFDFGKDYWPSPFWNFHRRLAEGLGLHYRAVLWTNLVRFDGATKEGEPASIIGRPYEEALLEIQHGLLRQEVEELGIQTVVFVTGPRYDHVIKREIQDCQFFPLTERYSERQLAKIEAPSLSGVKLLRTYHPRYLRYMRKFDDIADLVIANCRRSVD